MNDMQADVARFHKAFGHPVQDEPTLIPHDRGKLRYDLIEEELEEYRTAILEDDLVEVADALGDLLFVVYGAAVEHGIDLQPVFEEIVSSNMSKLGEDGKPVPHPRIPGKIGKGPHYRKPDIRSVLASQG